MHHGGWVVVTNDPERLAAMATEAPPVPENSVPCPFCPGQEHLTPHEIAAKRPKDSQAVGPNWDYRVIPARRPILVVEGTPDREGVGLYDRMRGLGAQEVLIENPDHYARIEAYEPDRLPALLSAIQERMRDLERDKRLRLLHYRRIFNPQAHGHEAHPHGLVMGSAVIPDRVQVELSSARQYWQYKERCVICDMLREERKIGDRVIAETHGAVAGLPYASRSPFETHIIPERHSHAFAEAQPEELAACAELIQYVWSGLVRVLPDWRLNLRLDTARTEVEAPWGWESIQDDYHWHFEIHPSPPTPPPAWTDFGGLPVCPVPPEIAAAALREACGV